MAPTTIDYILGLLKCTVGLALIIYGLSGINKNNRKDRRDRRRGFALSPTLYLLSMIGVLGGVAVSGYSQILHSGQKVQQSIMARTDMQGAANMLSANAVLGTDGMTLCPPRSTHLSEGNLCSAAPVALTQFSDFRLQPLRWVSYARGKFQALRHRCFGGIHADQCGY